MYPNTPIPKTYQARAVMLIAVLVLTIFEVKAQSVTEIITDYNGYWKTSASSHNPNKPKNSHNLLAFTYNGVRYSTGVDDASLVVHGESFMAGMFKALPVQSITGKITGNTKVGLGALYDGVTNGAPVTAPVHDIPLYLTDGKNGLDLGTGVANLPVGSMYFSVTEFPLNSIGDGIPDILVTQVADPAGSTDYYEFTDVNGSRIGNTVQISFNNIATVATWTADFYEANVKPMVLTNGFTQTDRPIKLWAADFSAFGITPANIGQVSSFKINLNGNSDVAFVAYNTKSLNIGLPVTFSFFKGATQASEVKLFWQTEQEKNVAKHIIERSIDGKEFAAIDSISSVDNTDLASSYHYTHKNAGAGRSSYRIRVVNRDGSFELSQVLHFGIHSAATTSISAYPNPARGAVTIKHAVSSGNDKIEIRTLNGKLVYSKQINHGSKETLVSLNGFKAGIYTIVCNSQAKMLMIGK
jgi:hypothetical protein